MEYLFALIIPALWVFIYFKRRNRKIDVAPQEQVIEGTDTDRETADLALRQLPMNIRHHLIQTHALTERFSTRHGYTAIYVEEIAMRLRQAGCACEVVFQPGAIAGVADSLLEQQGHYELWISNDTVEQARPILAEIIR